MHVRVTCSGVLIGSAEFEAPVGLAHATLAPTPAYALAARAAHTLALRFSRTQPWDPARGDFAEAIADSWDGGRLALEDPFGRELAAHSVVVLDGIPGPPGQGSVRVVADFRSDLARAQARAESPDRGGSQTRPAA